MANLGESLLNVVTGQQAKDRRNLVLEQNFV
jgi:hypothetical protein